MILLAKNLRFLRKSCGLSQTELASRLDLNRNKLASYESGNAEPKASVLLQIINHFDIQLNDLLEVDLEEVGYVFSEKKKNGKHRSYKGDEKPLLRSFAQRTANLMKMLNGFKEFHLYKLNTGETTWDLALLIQEYEKLLDLVDDHLRLNQELIAKLEG